MIRARSVLPRPSLLLLNTAKGCFPTQWSIVIAVTSIPR